MIRLFFVIALVVAACSSDRDDASPATTDAAAATAPTAEPTPALPAPQMEALRRACFFALADVQAYITGRTVTVPNVSACSDALGAPANCVAMKDAVAKMVAAKSTSSFNSVAEPALRAAINCIGQLDEMAAPRDLVPIPPASSTTRTSQTF